MSKNLKQPCSTVTLLKVPPESAPHLVARRLGDVIGFLSKRLPGARAHDGRRQNGPLFQTAHQREADGL